MVFAKTILIPAIGIVMVLKCATGSAAAITIGGNDVLNVFDRSYSDIYAHDTSTANIMLGGNVLWYVGYDYSIVNVEAGSVASRLELTNYASATVTGGDINYLLLYGQSSANLYNNADVGYLWMHDSSAANIYDGTVSWVILSNSSSANLYNGDISWLVIDETSVADLYVSNYSYSVNGILSGQWRDGTNFSMWLRKGPYLSPQQQPPPVLGNDFFVHTVPLPLPAFLFVSGLVSLLFYGKRNSG